MGLEDTALPSAVVDKEGRLGGWGLGLAGPKHQERQRDPPIPTERPVRIWSSPAQRLRATQSGQPREGAGRLGPWGGWQMSSDDSALVSVRSTSASPASCKMPRHRQRWCWTGWRPGRSDSRAGIRRTPLPLAAPPETSQGAQMGGYGGQGEGAVRSGHGWGWQSHLL